MKALFVAVNILLCCVWPIVAAILPIAWRRIPFHGFAPCNGRPLRSGLLSENGVAPMFCTFSQDT